MQSLRIGLLKSRESVICFFFSKAADGIDDDHDLYGDFAESTCDSRAESAQAIVSIRL